MAVAMTPLLRAPTPEIRRLMCEESVTAAEAARRLGIHSNTMYRLLTRGGLPLRAIKVGRVWRINKADLDRLLDAVEAREQ